MGDSERQRLKESGSLRFSTAEEMNWMRHWDENKWPRLWLKEKSVRTWGRQFPERGRVLNNLLFFLQISVKFTYLLCAHAPRSIHVEAGGQPPWIGSLPPPCVFWGLNSGLRLDCKCPNRFEPSIVPVPGTVTLFLKGRKMFQSGKCGARCQH